MSASTLTEASRSLLRLQSKLEGISKKINAIVRFILLTDIIEIGSDLSVQTSLKEGKFSVPWNVKILISPVPIDNECFLCSH